MTYDFKREMSYHGIYIENLGTGFRWNRGDIVPSHICKGTLLSGRKVWYAPDRTTKWELEADYCTEIEISYCPFCGIRLEED
jgi:hypothetical protein